LQKGKIMAVVTMNSFNKAALQNMTGTGGVLATCSVALFTSSVAPGPDTVLADLQEATFGGYARSSAISWTAPYSQPDGSWAVSGDTKKFQMTTIGTSETISMYGVLSGTGTATALQTCEVIDNPVFVSQVGDAVIVVAQHAVADAGGASASIIS
jgi:hypothetical protein